MKIISVSFYMSIIKVSKILNPNSNMHTMSQYNTIWDYHLNFTKKFAIYSTKVTIKNWLNQANKFFCQPDIRYYLVRQRPWNFRIFILPACKSFYDVNYIYVSHMYPQIGTNKWRHWKMTINISTKPKCSQV